MLQKKAPGPNGVLTEMLVAAGEHGLEELTRLTNMVYDYGYFPEELNKSIFITLPKISGTTKCEKHCTISLMSHIYKVDSTCGDEQSAWQNITRNSSRTAWL